MPNVEHCFVLDGEIEGFEDWEAAVGKMPPQKIADQCEGAAMLYSSGTTGYPKGVKRPLPEQEYGEEVVPNLMLSLIHI